jgi:hypothetical protein
MLSSDWHRHVFRACGWKHDYEKHAAMVEQIRVSEV